MHSNVRACLHEFLLNKCGVRVAPADADLMVGLGLSSQIIRRVEEIHRRRLGGQMRRSAVGVITEAYYALLRHRKSFGESLAVNQHAEGVVLTTVHQAKGLEWPALYVYRCWMQEDFEGVTQSAIYKPLPATRHRQVWNPASTTNGACFT